MKITLKRITVSDLVDGYFDDDDGGVRGYGGKLDIRPPYQRNFVYNQPERDAVINTVQNGFPLNIMYWAVRDDGTYEVIDGQQRTISICQYLSNNFSIDGLMFTNLQNDKQEKIRKYELDVYFCEGTVSEKLDWFKIVNVAGKPLNDQELLNAIFTGNWLADAKRHFSRTQGPAFGLGKDYVTGEPKNQDYLATVLKWISGNAVKDYMAAHQNDEDAQDLWAYFRSVIAWIQKTFPNTRGVMKNVDWGDLFNNHKDRTLNPKSLESKIQQLFEDEEVTRQVGIYKYVLTDEERHLNLRQFPKQIQNRVYSKQDKKCAICGTVLPIAKMQADHKIPWSDGGKTIEANCQMLCAPCNIKKSSK